jgi:membrane-bound ClpP family serine protease
MMVKIIAIVAPMLLLIGTVGLLLNEFILGWGGTATITFAVFNIIGIVLLISSNWHYRSSNENKSMQE